MNSRRGLYILINFAIGILMLPAESWRMQTASSSR